MWILVGLIYTLATAWYSASSAQEQMLCEGNAY